MKKILILISSVFLLTTFTAKAEDFFSIPDYVSKSDRELLKKARKKIMQENPKCVSVDYGSTVSERSENGNIAQKYEIFAKVSSQFCQILKSYSRKLQKSLKIN